MKRPRKENEKTFIMKSDIHYNNKRRRQKAFSFIKLINIFLFIYCYMRLSLCGILFSLVLPMLCEKGGVVGQQGEERYLNEASQH